jgi:hypothetical protein
MSSVLLFVLFLFIFPPAHATSNRIYRKDQHQDFSSKLSLIQRIKTNSRAANAPGNGAGQGVGRSRSRNQAAEMSPKELTTVSPVITEAASLERRVDNEAGIFKPPMSL